MSFFKNLFKGNKEQEVKKEQIVPLTNGELVNISQVPDEVFSSKMMGDGFAMKTSDGIIVSPVEGTIVTVFPTKHAVGLISNEGTELLIHIGIDTVQLEGKYFETFVKQGQSVKKGDLLLKFDIERIQNAGYSTQVPIIVTNTQDYMDILVTNQSTIHQNEVLLTAVNAQTTELVANPV